MKESGKQRSLWPPLVWLIKKSKMHPLPQCPSVRRPSFVLSCITKNNFCILSSIKTRIFSSFHILISHSWMCGPSSSGKNQLDKQIKLTGWDENELNCIQTTPIFTGYIILFGASRECNYAAALIAFSLSRPSASHPLVVKPLCLDK